MNVGELEVKVKSLSVEPLSQKSIDDLKTFHWSIFEEVLELVKDFTVFDGNNAENSYLCVPGRQT